MEHERCSVNHTCHFGPATPTKVEFVAVAKLKAEKAQVLFRLHLWFSNFIFSESQLPRLQNKNENSSRNLNACGNQPTLCIEELQ